MEWQQLEYFQTVARMQNITSAARAMNITQPALSRSIARLESELNVPLFERKGRSIVLNRYGELFLARVERIMEEYQAGRREIEQLLDPERGEVSLGFLHTLGIRWIPDLIGKFRESYPSVRFQLHQNSNLNLLHQLHSGEIDLCMSSPQETPLNIHWTKLWTEELFLAVPVHHRLAGVKSVALEELQDEMLISYKEGYGLRHIMDELLHQAGISPKILFEGEEIHTIAGLVCAGLGIAILPKTEGINEDGLVWVTITDPDCNREIGIAWVEGKFLSPAANLFKQFVIHTANQYYKQRAITKPN
ncbi:LysR family transcriptional regulator [Paenibacillus sp. 79R4]|uniref:LysR family transcriptional regulator n=1 Tax=Paenibacillus sp. 79R4 TaxID=2212847 RepID=UPI0015B98723|nr:LysR family transcriptional regulator [Paenibacillus sp. 79R4]